MEPKYDLKILQDYKILDYTSFAKTEDFDFVYRPNDDTFLFLDALRLEFEKNKPFPHDIIIEIGTGSGIIINNYAAWWIKENVNNLYFGIDINFDACMMTQAFSKNYNTGVEIINANILKGLSSQLKGNVDIIICNPPYVPTTKEELIFAKQALSDKNDMISKFQKNDSKINCIDASYAGGVDGTEVTYQILDQCIEYLSKNGSLYVLLIEENRPEYIIDYMKELGLSSELLVKKQFQNEIQYIFKFAFE